MPTLRQTAVAAARAAGEIQRAHHGTRLEVDRSDRHDVKLRVDRLCERAICERIRADFGDHAILTEEAGMLDAPGEYQWIIDPLDGTVNFYYGIPHFCAAVACYHRPAAPPEADAGGLEAVLGEPVVGVVYAPPTDELFVAEIGGGATCNGRPIHAADVAELAEAIVCTGFGTRRGVGPTFVRQCAELAAKVRKVRCMGAACYDLCHVAAGRLSGYFQADLRTWDLAAPLVILREAGAVYDTWATDSGTWDVLASAPGIHDELREMLRGK